MLAKLTFYEFVAHNFNICSIKSGLFSLLIGNGIVLYTSTSFERSEYWKSFAVRGGKWALLKIVLFQSNCNSKLCNLATTNVLIPFKRNV